MQPDSEGRRNPYLRIWVDDIKGSCIDFSAAQFGAHMRMLLVAWERGHVPTEDRILKRIVGEIDWDEMPMVVARWRRAHIDGVGEVYVNARLERERERMIQDAERRRAAGKLGADKRWGGRGNAQSCNSDSTTNGIANGTTNGTSDGETMPFPDSHIPIVLNSGEAKIPKDPQSVVGSAPRKRGRPADPLVWSWDTGFTGISEEDIARWKDAYGAIDVESEIKQADEHVRAYPEKQHMKRWRRFLTDWLARSNRWAIERAKRGNDSGGRSGTPKRTRVHIPADAHPDYEHEWFMPNGWTPRYAPIYHDITGREKWNGGGYLDEDTGTQGDHNANDE